METLVCLHAHPDDECISTGGTMARAAEEGHRVVLIVATNGEHGEVPDDLADGETLADRRRAETEASAMSTLQPEQRLQQEEAELAGAQNNFSNWNIRLGKQKEFLLELPEKAPKAQKR